MNKKTIVFALLLCLNLTFNVFPASTFSKLAICQPQKKDKSRSKATTFRNAEPNLYAPQLYADELSLRMALVDLPGAKTNGSNLEISYHLYFVSEAENKEVMDKLLAQSRPQNGVRTFSGSIDPGQYTKKILIVEGKINKTTLATPQERIVLLDKISFKSKVPDQIRTKFGYLMTFYSIKIFDAKLKLLIYRSGSFMTFPFEDDQTIPKNVISRKILYANFFVTQDGQLFTSQLP